LGEEWVKAVPLFHSADFRSEPEAGSRFKTA